MQYTFSSALKVCNIVHMCTAAVCAVQSHHALLCVGHITHSPRNAFGAQLVIKLHIVLTVEALGAAPHQALVDIFSRGYLCT